MNFLTAKHFAEYEQKLLEVFCTQVNTTGQSELEHLLTWY